MKRFAMGFAFFGSLLMLLHVTQGQSRVNAENLDAVTNMMFNFGTKMLTANDNPYQEVEYNEDDFFKPSLSESQFKTVVADVEKSEVQVTTSFGKPCVRVKTMLTVADYSSVNLSFLNGDISNKNGDKLGLSDRTRGGGSGQQVDLQIPFDAQSMDTTGATGYVDIEVKVLKGYAKVKLTRDVLGKTFNLAGCEYFVLDLRGNLLVLDKRCEEDIKLNMIHFTSEGKVAKAYSSDELKEMQTSNPSIDTRATYNTQISGLQKSVYDRLTDNNSLTLEDFKKEMTLEKVQSLEKEDSYAVVKSIAPLSGEFVLYTPEYYSETIRLNLQ